MSEQPLRIVIVGGVAGGASAATRARRMNERAQITMLEKDGYVSFANCGLPYYLGGEIENRDKLLVVTPELFAKRFSIDVRTRHEVTAIDRGRKVVAVLNQEAKETFDLPYDKLILAPGAAPIVPPIDGVDAANVFTLRNIEDTDRIKGYLDVTRPERAVVIGAGYIGLEMVEQLRGLEIDVSLVEMQDRVLPLLDPEMSRLLEDEIQSHGVDLHLGDGIRSVKAERGLATAVELQSGALIKTDLVIMGVGVRPNVKLAVDAGLTLGATGGIRTNQHSQTDDPDVYAVGDAAEYEYGPTGEPMRVPLAGPANRAGRLAGEHAAVGSADPLTPVFGTSIARVFGITAGMTGLSRGQAARLGREAKSVTITANQHAGYYPGAEPMRLKLVYEPSTGKVLGAQAAGPDGIDKRIDVIATAMRFDATVRELAGLDLAYAPPFGSAKDPVHVAAFAASNELDGRVKVLDPDADLTGMQVLDVRSPAEVAKKPLPRVEAVVHIPLDELRGRLDELDKSRPTVVSCASGLRSYIASRILRQSGFDEVYNLTGGATLRAQALREDELHRQEAAR